MFPSWVYSIDNEGNETERRQTGSAAEREIWVGVPFLVDDDTSPPAPRPDHVPVVRES